jgi:hypothetical protein
MEHNRADLELKIHEIFESRIELFKYQVDFIIDLICSEHKELEIIESHKELDLMQAVLIAAELLDGKSVIIVKDLNLDCIKWIHGMKLGITVEISDHVKEYQDYNVFNFNTDAIDEIMAQKKYNRYFGITKNGHGHVIRFKHHDIIRDLSEFITRKMTYIKIGKPIHEYNDDDIYTLFSFMRNNSAFVEDFEAQKCFICNKDEATNCIETDCCNRTMCFQCYYDHFEFSRKYRVCTHCNTEDTSFTFLHANRNIKKVTDFYYTIYDFTKVYFEDRGYVDLYYSPYGNKCPDLDTDGVIIHDKFPMDELCDSLRRTIVADRNVELVNISENQF